MAKTLNVTYTGSSSDNVSAGTNFLDVFGGDFGSETTEALCQVILRSPGTLSNMWANISTNTIAATVTFVSRIATANGNQTFTVAASTNGTFTDSTHTDTISAGNKVTIQNSGGASNSMNITINSFIFAATTNTVTKMSCDGAESVFGSSSTTTFFPITGVRGLNNNVTTENAGIKARQFQAGTFTNMMVDVTTAGAGTRTFNSRLNGGAGALTISVTATGFLEDTTHTDTVASGNDYDMSFAQGTTIAGWANLAVDFTTTTNNGYLLNAIDELAGGTGQPLSANTTNYFGLAGDVQQPTTTETQAQVLTNIVITFNNLTCVITTNTVSSNSTLNLRANAGAAGSVSATITASTTGIFSDTTHTYLSASTDLMDKQLVIPAAGTSLSIQNIGLWANAGPLLNVRAISEVLDSFTPITGSTS